MVKVSDVDAQGEQDRAGSGDGELSRTRVEDVLVKGAASRMTASVGSSDVPEDPQDLFAASIARNLAPQLQAGLTQQLQPALDALQLQIRAWITQSIAPQFDHLRTAQLDAFRQLARWVIPQFIDLLPLDHLAELLPPNWKDVPDLDVSTVIGIVLEEGVPLVWVPQAAIVAELVGAANADARDGILVSSRVDIADDCLTVIREITDAKLKPLARLAAEAVIALRTGHSSSAQALATNVFDTLLRDATRRGMIFVGSPDGYFKYPKVRKQITPVSDDTDIGQFRSDCVLSAALAALQDYDPSDPPPGRFVRHATAHSARPEQYTPVNAIVAVMLMASTLREAQASGW